MNFTSGTTTPFPRRILLRPAARAASGATLRSIQNRALTTDAPPVGALQRSSDYSPSALSSVATSCSRRWRNRPSPPISDEELHARLDELSKNVTHEDAAEAVEQAQQDTAAVVFGEDSGRRDDDGVDREQTTTSTPRPGVRFPTEY